MEDAGHGAMFENKTWPGNRKIKEFCVKYVVTKLAARTRTVDHGGGWVGGGWVVGGAGVGD